MCGRHSSAVLVLLVHQSSGCPLCLLKKEVTSRGKTFLKHMIFGTFHIIPHWGPTAHGVGPGQGGGRGLKGSGLRATRDVWDFMVSVWDMIRKKLSNLGR